MLKPEFFTEISGKSSVFPSIGLLSTTAFLISGFFEKFLKKIKNIFLLNAFLFLLIEYFLIVARVEKWFLERKMDQLMMLSDSLTG